MTSTSSQSSQTGGRGAFRSGHESLKAQGASKDVIPAALSSGYAAETLRMKTFASQRKFQAPLADDFARGMLAPGQASHTHAKGAKHPVGVWATLVNCLTAWCCGHKPG